MIPLNNFPQLVIIIYYNDFNKDSPDMKNILMLGTGGTIASEMTPDGLTPELTPQQLLRYVPAISSLCRVDCKSLFSLDVGLLIDGVCVPALGNVQSTVDDLCAKLIRVIGG